MLSGPASRDRRTGRYRDRLATSGAPPGRTSTRRPPRRCIRWPAGAAGRARRRLGRPGPALRAGPPGTPAARRGPGRRRRGAGRPPRRGLLRASGTAAVHAAVLAGLAGRRRAGRTLVHSAIEHSAVLHAARAARRGRRRRRSPSRWTGWAGSTWTRSAAAVAGPGCRAGRADQRQPRGRHACSRSAEVGRRLCAAGVPLHVDAAQSLGRVPVPGGWSLLTASAHKWGGPPGVGVLVVRKGTRWVSPLPAGADDRRSAPATRRARRPGPAGGGGGGGGAARGGGGRGGRGGPAAALVDRIRAAVRGDRADVEVVGDPVRPAAAPGDLLLPVRRRRGAAARAGPARLRRLVRLVVHSSTLRPSTCWRRWACSPTATSGSRCTAAHAEAEVDRFLAELPGIVAELRRAAGVVGR